MDNNIITNILQLSDIKIRRFCLLSNIYTIIKNYDYDLDSIFNFIKNEENDESSRGYLIQTFVPISLYQPLHRDKILTFLTEYCRVNPFHRNRRIWEAVIFYLFAVDKRKLINLTFADSELNQLKSSFLFNVKDPKIRFSIPSSIDFKVKQGLSFSHILQEFINLGELEYFRVFRKFLLFSYKFPFLNTMQFLSSWTGLDKIQDKSKILSPAIFIYNDNYIIFDPEERAKIERFIHDDKYYQDIYDEIKSKKEKLKRENLQQEFLNNFNSIADIYTDIGTCYYGFNGKIRFDKQIQNIFNLDQKTPFFKNIMEKFYSKEFFSNKYVINGIITEVTISPVIKSNLKIGYLILLKNVTEEELFKKFSGHDIKNSLISIISTFELLKENKKLRKSDQQLIASGEKNISSLREKFNDFFSFKSRGLSFSPCNLNLLLNKAIASQSAFATQKQIKLKLKEKNCDHTFIICDSKKIFRVFENLISNAIKYSDNKTKVEIILEETKQEAIIKFIDQGYGISEEYGENIFNLGVRQSHDDYKKEVAGSGIGLAVVKKFITLHKGKIFYNQNKNKGTTFTIILPLEIDD